MPRVAIDPIDRFWSHVDKDSSPDGCWLWTGCVSKDGYGSFKVDGQTRIVHRWAFEVFNYPIPHGFQIDHVYENGCRNKNCVNFEEHLEPVTNRENSKRYSESLTHCKHGHAFTVENTRIRKSGRQCIRCHRDWANNKYQESKRTA